MRPKLIQIVAYHDYMVGLDSEGRLWKIRPGVGPSGTEMYLISSGDLVA